MGVWDRLRKAWGRADEGTSVPIRGEASAHEASDKLTFLRPSDWKTETVRLYGLETRILHGEYEEHDLVEQLHSAQGGVPLQGLTQVNQYLAVRTLEALSALDDAKIAGNPFPMGYVEPVQLLSAPTIEQYVHILLHDYPEYALFIPEFTRESTVVGRRVQNVTITSVEQLMRLTQMAPDGVGSERNPKDRYGIIRSITNDFDAIDEPLSLGRLRLINPYSRILADAPLDRRRDMLWKMIHCIYPFRAENRYCDDSDNWMTEILAAQDIGR